MYEHNAHLTSNPYPHFSFSSMDGASVDHGHHLLFWLTALDPQLARCANGRQRRRLVDWSMPDGPCWGQRQQLWQIGDSLLLPLCFYNPCQLNFFNFD
jgi:hypothetical protein